MKNKDNMLDVTLLKEALEVFKEDPTEENAVVVLKSMTIVAGMGRKVHMPLLDITRCVLDFNPDTEVEDLFEDGPEPEELFVFIESVDGRRWFPLFTDKNELGDVEKTNAIRTVTIRSIMETALNIESIDGIMINPDRDAFAVSKEAFEFMLEQAEMFEGMEEAGVSIRLDRSEKKNTKK